MDGIGIVIVIILAVLTLIGYVKSPGFRKWVNSQLKENPEPKTRKRKKGVDKSKKS